MPRRSMRREQRPRGRRPPPDARRPRRAARILLVLGLATRSRAAAPSSPFRIVIDAGSTGSRLHIFELVQMRAADPSSRDERVGTGAPSIDCLRRGSSKAWTPLSAFAAPDPDRNGHRRAALNATHVAQHLLPLFDYAAQIIPAAAHATTKVRIAATAGMRLVPAAEQARVYDALYEGLREQGVRGRFRFAALKREHVLTLLGDREGFYGAVAANYLRGVIDAELQVIVPREDDEEDVRGSGERDDGTAGQGLCTNKFGTCEMDAEDLPLRRPVPRTQHDVKRHGPLGALDMGGSSTQIVYRHSAGENGAFDATGVNNSVDRDHATGDSGGDYDLPSHLHDKEFFSTSYLSYGADQFRERLWNLWISEAPTPIIYNPCSFSGYQMSYMGYTLLGTGDAVLCAEQINRLIPHHNNAINLDELREEHSNSSKWIEGWRRRSTKRKMVGGVEHPPVHGKFYAMSLYFFTLDCLRELSAPDHPLRGAWPTPSLAELTHALDAFCARRWPDDGEVGAHAHTRTAAWPHRCVEAVYMVTLLRDGFGFRPAARDITFAHRVAGHEVEWSLGMVLSDFAAEAATQDRGNSA